MKINEVIVQTRIGFLGEELVNRNVLAKQWQLRRDDRTFTDEYTEILLGNATVYVDGDAVANDKKIFAYIHGTPVRGQQDLEGMATMPLRYTRNFDHPFMNAETREPFTSADFVKFNADGSVIAYTR